MMTKKEQSPCRQIHRVNLSLPIVQRDSYEIYYTIPSSQGRPIMNQRLMTRRKPAIDNRRKNANPTEKRRSLPRKPGPVVVNLFVDIPHLANTPSTEMADTISQALINSGYSGRTLRAVPLAAKRNKQQNSKDDGNRSRSSSGDRLLYESLVSFEEHTMQKGKDGMWLNLHHPQLTTAKVLHARRSSKRLLGAPDIPNALPNSVLFENLSQESNASANERLYERIEELTRLYFPTIQQIRHGNPSPDMINNRLHLHREQKKDFAPILSRSRIVQ